MKKIPKPILVGLIVLIVLFIVGTGLVVWKSDPNRVDQTEFDLDSLVSSAESLRFAPSIDFGEITAESGACFDRPNAQFTVAIRCEYKFAESKANVRSLSLDINPESSATLTLSQAKKITIVETITSDISLDIYSAGGTLVIECLDTESGCVLEIK